jgi:hypothetical protein
MAKQRTSFLLHFDSLEILNELSDEEAGQLFKAIKAHHESEELALSPLVRVAFASFKNQFVRDEKKYEETCKRRAEAGSKGGVAKASKSKQKVASASKSKQDLANLADSDSKKKKKSDSKSDSDNKRFIKPTPQELIEYFESKGSDRDQAERFFNHYESNGWKVGRNSMKSWKAAVSNWLKNNYSQPAQQQIQQDDTSWANNMQPAYLPNQQKALGHE